MSAVPSRRSFSPFLIGLFVIIGTLSIIGVVIWLGATQFFKENEYYSTYFSGSVGGLEVGSAVKYMGVPVGSVKKVAVAPDGKLIEVIMTIDRKLKLESNIRVKAEMSGIAGGKYLQLFYTGDSSTLNAYPYLSFKPEFVVIKSSPSGIEEIETAARDVMGKLMQIRYKEVADEIINFLQTTNDFFKNEELLGIITGLNDASVKINSILARADSSNIINYLTLTSQKLLNTSNKLENFADSLNYQIRDLELSNRLDKAFFQYDSLVVQIRGLANSLGYRLDNSIFGLDETLTEIRATNKQLQKTLKAYRDNPGQLLLSTPPPPEK